MVEKITRVRKLSQGWYPDNSNDIKSFINKCIKSSDIKERNKIAAIVPHAGWEYSGSIAVKTIGNMYPDPDTVVIIGGHLFSGSPIYYSSEDLYQTPLGNFNINKEYISKLVREFEMVEDFSNDNTIEVIIPIAKYFFPKAKILCLRVGSGQESIFLGTILHRISLEMNEKIVVIGSTDLTHYGSNFNFRPHGNGVKAVKWVQEVNDKEIIEKMMKLDYSGVLNSATKNSSACSSGAASASIRFASLSNVKSGELIGYSNSYDIYPSESFVGYVGITY